VFGGAPAGPIVPKEQPRGGPLDVSLLLQQLALQDVQEDASAALIAAVQQARWWSHVQGLYRRDFAPSARQHLLCTIFTAPYVPSLTVLF